MDLPHGGRLRHFFKEWCTITHDREVLNNIAGVKIPFVGDPPVQTKLPREIPMNSKQKAFVDQKLESMLKDRCIMKLKAPLKDGWMNSIFLTPKRDSSFRLICNLSSLNEHILYRHFLMHTIQHALNMMNKSWFLASIDLKDAFSLLYLARSEQKYTQFQWRRQTYCYRSMPQGIAIGPITFVRTTKPLIAWLRAQGVNIMIYIDDTFLCAASAEKLRKDIEITIRAFERFGLVINYSKSILTPVLKLDFLGFSVDAQRYVVSLLQSKRERIFRMCEAILQKPDKAITIRHLAKIIGTFVSCFPCSLQAQLHYRKLERFKILKLQYLSWDSKIVLSELCITEIHWWSVHIFSHAFERQLSQMPINEEMSVDSSGYGWGCAFRGQAAKSRFNAQHMSLSINSKELLAIKFGIQSFLSQLRDSHLLVLSDNRTAISCVRRRGSKQEFRDNLTVELFQMLAKNNITLSITHLAGKLNKTADFYSRTFTAVNTRTEWSLSPFAMQLIKQIAPPFNIDLFASHLNAKHEIFCSRYPSPGAFHIDSFTMSWSGYHPLIHAPYSLIQRVFKKIRQDQVQIAICILPNWKTAIWYPEMLALSVKRPYILPRRVTRELRLPWDPNQQHPLNKTLRLLLVILSGSSSPNKTFRATTQTMLPNLLGENARKNKCPLSFDDGNPSVMKRMRTSLI